MKIKLDAFKFIVDKAMGSRARIVLPEGNDSRIQEAAEWAGANGLCRIILLGDKTLQAKFSKKALKNITIINPKLENRTREQYANTLYEIRKDKGMTPENAAEAVKDNIMFATMMLHACDADGIVAGAEKETADVLRPAFQIIKTRADITKVSSVMLMEMPQGSNLGKNGLMVFADPAVNPNPSSEELADIAILSAHTAQTICSIKPIVALLSYTTKAAENYDSEVVQKVKNAYRIARRKDSSLVIDGEMQADAALSPVVCEAKCKGSIVGGKANVLVFPDIVSSNISYKLVQRIAGVRAVGPILQGLNKPVNDLSRGTSAEEIVLNIAITVLQSRE
jgi:phosphate acetyltransferase